MTLWRCLVVGVLTESSSEPLVEGIHLSSRISRHLPHRWMSGLGEYVVDEEGEAV